MTVATIHGAEVAHYGGPSAAVSRASLPERMEYARNLAVAGLLPAAYRQNPGNLLLALEMSEALGIHHMTAINGVHVVEGKPTLSAELMRALILRAGHRFDVEEFGSEKVTVAVARRERPEAMQRFTYTIEDARRAKVTGKAVWQQHPGPMLLARASSTAARAVFPDVIAGMGFTPEELGARIDDFGAPVVEAAPVAAALLAAPAVPVDDDTDVVDLLHQAIEQAASAEHLNAAAAQIVAAERTQAIDADDARDLRSAMTERAGQLPAGKKALKRMHAALGELQLTADRAEKLKAVSNVVGRTVESTSDLTGAEADLVWRRASEAVQDGGRVALLHPTGDGQDDTDAAVPEGFYRDPELGDVPLDAGVDPAEFAA